MIINGGGVWMRLTELWQTKGKPTISFEFFPARNPKAEQGLEKAIDDISGLKPDFISVTFGAGGSTREGSYNLVKKFSVEKGLKTLAYFACYGLGPDEIISALDAYQKLGIENILAVRGDSPHDQPDFKLHPESLPHASDLIVFIKSRYQFCLGAAGYPEGHVEAESKEKDLGYLKLKIDSGADFIIANYFYDNRFFFDFVDRCRKIGIRSPIIPGVMPIYSVKLTERLASLCGAKITDEIRDGLAKIPEGDKEKVAAFGIEFAVAQCRDLLRNGVPGIHIYTMDYSTAAKEITRQLREDGLL
jgi:methylenetetrahydrofolate reductase (NADPH)